MTLLCISACADIVFVLDASGSVGLAQFKVDMLQFVLHQVQSLSLGPNSFQVGVITFGNKAKINIPLDRSHDQSELKNLILGIPYKDENTNTSGGLREMRERLFTEDYGSRQGRRKIGILLTDGRSTYDKSKTIPGRNCLTFTCIDGILIYAFFLLCLHVCLTISDRICVAFDFRLRSCLYPSFDSYIARFLSVTETT